jgi:hypothetical protein
MTEDEKGKLEGEKFKKIVIEEESDDGEEEIL